MRKQKIKILFYEVWLGTDNFVNKKPEKMIKESLYLGERIYELRYVRKLYKEAKWITDKRYEEDKLEGTRYYCYVLAYYVNGRVLTLASYERGKVIEEEIDEN